MRDKELLEANLKEVLSTSAGREVIWHFLGLCGLYTYIPEKLSGAALGRREVGLDILQLMDSMDPKAYAKLLLTKNSEELLDE